MTGPATEPPAPPGLAATAAAVGAAAWWEGRTFELAGAWAVTADRPAVRVHLAAVSRHAAWRAEVLGARLPRLRELAVEELLAPPAAGAPVVAARLAALEGTPERLAALQRVLLPRLLVGHGRLLEGASPVTDAPLRRWLPKVVDDLTADWAAGEALLQDVLASPGPAAAAASAVGALDGLLAAEPAALPHA